VRTLIYKEWDEDRLRGGAYGWHSGGRENRFGYGSAIVDWRWMHDNDFFSDYFRKEYVEKSKMYNYVSFAERFAAGTLSLTVREDARENTLTVEKLPEMRFYTPARLVGSSTVLGNDLSATHFRTPAGEYVRASETLTLERKWSMGPVGVRPYAALSAVAYRGTGDDLLSFPEEAGIEFSALWERRNAGETSGHLVPFVSLVGRSANLKPVDLPALDRRERFLNGRFVEAGGDWSFWRAGTMVGRVGLRNSYDIGRDSFADSLVSYGFSLAGRCRVAGENVWNFADGAYVFGANDFIWEGGRTRFSVGNRYARSDYSGFENWLEHDFGEGLRGRFGLLYDLKNEGAVSEHVQIWKRLHCWTVSLGLSRDDKDTSVSLAFAPGRLLDMDTWKGRFLKWR